MGLFASEIIPKGKIFWELKKGLDIIITQEEFENLTKLEKEYFNHFAYYNEGDGGWVLCGDNARFTNHSVNPSYIDNKDGTCSMVKDVLQDEEIFGNYFEFNEKEPKDLYQSKMTSLPESIQELEGKLKDNEHWVQVLKDRTPEYEDMVNTLRKIKDCIVYPYNARKEANDCLKRINKLI